jgi:hypothetical protein
LRHLGRVELDHPVVQTVADSCHGADGSVVVSTLGDDRRASATAVTGGEPDQLAGVIVANGCEGAVASLNDDAAPPPSTTEPSAYTVGAIKPADANSATTAPAMVGCTALPAYSVATASCRCREK